MKFFRKVLQMIFSLPFLLLFAMAGDGGDGGDGNSGNDGDMNSENGDMHVTKPEAESSDIKVTTPQNNDREFQVTTPEDKECEFQVTTPENKEREFQVTNAEDNTNKMEEDTLGKEKQKNDSVESNEKESPIPNKSEGLRREAEVKTELDEIYPSEKGYDVMSEVYLRNADGKIAKDAETGEARRVDFMVMKEGKIVDSVEVTSITADKEKQCAKESRIRESGGNYIKNSNGELVELPADLKTRIERRK